MNKNLIFWCVNEKYEFNLMCLYSVLQAQKYSTDTDYVILTTAINPYKFIYTKYLNKQIVLIDVDDDVNLYFSKIDTQQWSAFTYARFLMFKHSIFNNYDNILYLDTDAFIQRNIMQNVFKICNSIPEIGLVPEKTPYQISRFKRKCKENHLEYKQSQYGNAGVILFNNKNLKQNKQKIFNDIIELTKKYSFEYHDQDILNFYFKNIYWLKCKYNFFKSTKTKCDYSPIIRHLAALYYQDKVDAFNQLTDNNFKTNIAAFIKNESN